MLRWITIVGAALCAFALTVAYHVLSMPIVAEDAQETMLLAGGPSALAAVAAVPCAAGALAWWLTRRRTA